MSDLLGIDWTGDLQGCIDDLGTSITIGNRCADCVLTPEMRALDVEEMGAYKTYARQAILPLSTLTTVPAIQSTVTTEDRIYYIADITRHDESDTLVLELRRDDGD